MKRIFTTLSLFAFLTIGFGQNQRARIPQEQQDIGVRMPTKCDINLCEHKSANPVLIPKSQPEVVTESVIGTTYYDLQTNKSNQNRFYRYPDGTMGATWMFGILHPNFTDRGTGYNYFNGTTWGTNPTSRIETVKTGWPSYAPLGINGEIVVSHIGTTGLNISKRTTKGTGTWTHTTFPGPTSNPNLLWPRMITSGVDHNTVHMMALTAPIANQGTLYNGSDGALLYSRSTDGGLTWGINNFQVPGTDTSSYVGLTGDCYAWAEPKGNTLAFVVGDNWHDLFLMKSTDNGTTWNKTVIWQHLYPFFDRSTPPYATDTFYCVDGSLAAAIDNIGNVHVFFGIQRTYSDGLQTYWFPLVDGLGYWNETMPPISSAWPRNTLHPDSLEKNGQLVGYALDVNNNGSINITAVGYYYISVSSMPTVLIDSNNHIFLVYASVMENFSSGTQNYRHLLGRKSVDGGYSWGDIVDLTMGIVHNYHECVFPSMAATSNNKVHLIYQQDNEPGLAVRGDLDIYDLNNIVYLSFDKTDLVHIPPGPQWTYTTTPYQHKIALPPLSGMLVNNVAITNGDYVGVFYNTASGLACGGYKKINSAYDTVVAYGTEVGQNNGFASGETFKWKIWKESTGLVHEAMATYDLAAPNTGNFVVSGQSKVIQLKGGTIEVMASPGPTVCPGTPVNMQILVTGGYPPYTYAWSPAASLNNPAIPNPVASPMQTTTYIVTVTDNAGLSGTAASTINIIPPPAVTLPPLPNACDTWPPYYLSGGLPTGGSYSGNYVTGGLFNPQAAGQGLHMVIYSYTDPVTTCIGHDTGYILVEHCVFINEMSFRDRFSIYPNPFNQHLIIKNVTGNGNQLNIAIYQADGRCVLQEITLMQNTDELQINTQNLAPGVYFLKVRQAEEEAAYKVIKTTH